MMSQQDNNQKPIDTPMITREEALDALECMFEQASNAPEMTLDEINAEISAVRAENE